MLLILLEGLAAVILVGVTVSLAGFFVNLWSGGPPDRMRPA